MVTINTNTVPEYSVKVEPRTTTIVEKIAAYLDRFMVFSHPAQSRVMALWILHTRAFADNFPERPYMTPYLYVNSMEPGCGKTTLLNLCRDLAYNPEKADNMTSSVMFRLIEAVHPTLLLDEIDTVFNGTKATEELRGVANSGYKMGGFIWRNAPGKDGPEPRKFDTFGPKVLAGIDNGQLPETLVTRCIEIALEKVGTLDENGQVVGPDGVAREIYYEFLAEANAEHIRREIDLFMAEWAARYSRYMPKPVPGLKPRQFEIAFPLLQVAHAVGCEAEAVEWIKAIFSYRPVKDTAEQATLRAIRVIFDETGEERIFSRDIYGKLGITGKKLSNFLAQYGIAPHDCTIGGKTGKAYYRAHFANVWAAELDENTAGH